MHVNRPVNRRSYLSIAAQLCSSPFKERIPEDVLRDILMGNLMLKVGSE